MHSLAPSRRFRVSVASASRLYVSSASARISVFAKKATREPHASMEDVLHESRYIFASAEEYDEAAHNKRMGRTWLGEGLNHRTWKDGDKSGIARDIPLRAWVIEIKSLQALIKFVEKYGEIVFNGDEIEIYDDYRE